MQTPDANALQIDALQQLTTTASWCALYVVREVSIAKMHLPSVPGSAKRGRPGQGEAGREKEKRARATTRKQKNKKPKTPAEKNIYPSPTAGNDQLLVRHHIRGRSPPIPSPHRLQNFRRLLEPFLLALAPAARGQRRVVAS